MLSLFKGKIETMAVLSKADLADEKITKEWAAYLKGGGLPAWPLDLRKGGAGSVRAALAKKKPSFRELRVAVVRRFASSASRSSARRTSESPC